MSSYFNAPDLDHTDERQAALRRYHILDTAPEKNFDQITSLVAKVCKVPTALISLIDKERQWFKSCFGFDARETGIGVSFCVHAVHDGEMLVVEDATKDPRFKDNPIVTGPPNLRFYAGAPLTTPEGIHIGSLCIIDYRPRVFDAAQREILEKLADMVVNEFESRSAAAQIRQLVDGNPQPMYVYAQSDGRILRSNPAACDLYGYTVDEFESLTADDVRASPEAHIYEDGAEMTLHERSDGTLLPMRLQEREVLFDGHFAVLAVCEVPATHAADALSFLVDREGTVRLMRGGEAVPSMRREHVVGSTLADLVDAEDEAAVSGGLSAVLSGEAAAYAGAVTLAGAPPHVAELRIEPMYNTRETPVGAFVTAVRVREHAPAAEGDADGASSEAEDSPATPSAPLPEDTPDLEPTPAGDEETATASDEDPSEAEGGSLHILSADEDESDSILDRPMKEGRPTPSEILERARSLYDASKGSAPNGKASDANAEAHG